MKVIFGWKCLARKKLYCFLAAFTFFPLNTYVSAAKAELLVNAEPLEVKAEDVVSAKCVPRDELAQILADYSQKAELSAYKEISQLRLESLRDLFQKDVQAIVGRSDAQDKRIDTQNSHLDQSIALMGLLIGGAGLLLTLLGYVGYRSVRSQTKEESEEAAEEWFRVHAEKLKNEISDLQDKLKKLEIKAHSHFESLVLKVQAGADSATQQIQEALNFSLSGFKVESESTKLSPKVSSDAAEALAEAAKNAESKPLSEYTFKDWTNRAFYSYKNRDLGSAAEFWRSAANHPDAAPDQVARTLLNLSLAYRESGKYEESLAVSDEVVKRFESDKDMKLQVSKALFGKAVTFGSMGKGEEELSTYDAIVARFKGESALELREQVARALFNKAATLGNLERTADEISVCDVILDKYAEAQEPTLRDVRARALLNKAMAYGKLGDWGRELEVYGSLILEYSADSSLEVREQVAKAIINKAIILDENGLIEESLSHCNDLLSRFHDEGSIDIQDALATALLYKGDALDTLGRADEALESYAELISRFGGHELPEIRVYVGRGLVNKAVVLSNLGRNEEAIEILDEAIKGFNHESLENREVVAGALLGKGIALNILGKGKAAVSEFDELIKRFGRGETEMIDDLIAKATLYKFEIINSIEGV